MLSLSISSPDPVSHSIIFSQLFFAACIGLALSYLLSSVLANSKNNKRQCPQREFLKGVSPTTDKPLIIPGRISHARLFPKHHSFAYPYLMVGIPVHSPNRGNWLLSVDERRAWWKRGWLRVEACDHLGRGGDEDGIYRKLQSYLESQGVDPAEYPYVFLITSPRLLNYKFSPASFWYLYSVQRELKAMISEVNNTFDERRMYFHPFNMNQLDDDVHHDEVKYSASENATLLLHPHRCLPREFKHVWSKDFHVSPFNSRKGTYSLSARDPCRRPRSIKEEAGASKPFIDIKATLLSSKGRPKMTARLWSTSVPLDPVTMPILDSIIFLSSWWWVGLVTYPRILVEAIKLAFRRGLSIYYRPEVKAGTMARKATAEEIFLSHIFHKYLVHLIAHIRTPLQIQYTSLDTQVRRWILDNNPLYSSSSSSSSVATPTATGTNTSPSPSNQASTSRPSHPIPTKHLQILSPAFYSRLAAHPTLHSSLASEIISSVAEENRTAQVSDDGELCALLAEAAASSEFQEQITNTTTTESPPAPHQKRRRRRRRQQPSLSDRLYWALVSALRRRPEPGSYPMSPGHHPRQPNSPKPPTHSPSTSTSTEKSAHVPTPPSQEYPMHFLDSFVQDHCSPDEQTQYPRTVLRLFLTDRIARDSLALLAKSYRVVLRIVLLGVAVWMVVSLKEV